MQKNNLKNTASKKTCEISSSQKNAPQTTTSNKPQSYSCTHMDIDGITVYFNRHR